MAYLAMALVLIIAFYTILFGVEQWQEKNYGGALAIMVLAAVVVGVPFVMLFLRG